jgi:arginine deiminase
MGTPERTQVKINSEIGKLETVITHTPGAEVENMTPENAARALYSDILNLSVALPEYNQFHSILKRFAHVFELRDLLSDVLKIDKVKNELIDKICKFESTDDICKYLSGYDHNELARLLIEGVEMSKDTLTKFLDDERFSVHPLPNFFFTRDAAFSMNDRVMISQMANKVRERESWIMEAIFNHHPKISTETINPVKLFDKSGKATIEGGDVLVVREDVFLIGISSRTTSQGIDSVLEYLKTKPGTKHLILQELPYSPESFIHLDMVFTLLDKHTCMIFEPLILRSSRHLTIHVIIEDKDVVKIKEEDTILSALEQIGMEFQPVFCGGNNSIFNMEREQWQSGANFFALAPGKVIGYGRNVHTMEALNNVGFEIFKARDILKNKVEIDNYSKYVITIEGAELSRGGGGARCMTMPLRRQEVDW